MSHGPQHFESNNWQGKGCRSVCRITIGIAWSINTKRIYEKLMLDQEYMSWLDRQAPKTKEKVRM